MKLTSIVCSGVALLLAVMVGGYLHLHARTQRAVDPETDSVLVTGASSGIGAHAALGLNAMGFLTFAGVRKMESFEALKSLAVHPDKLIPVILDVTNDDQISAAVDLVSEKVGDRGLTALFNNAGVSGPPRPGGMNVENYPVEEYRWVMEVNFYGMLKVTKSFMGLIKKSGKKGRILFNTSVAGIFSGAFASAYSASKYATEALIDSLRRELILVYGTRVVAIEPGFIYSKMTCKTLLWENDKLKEFRAQVAPEYMEFETREQAGILASMEEPKKVTDAVVDGILADNPLTRYVMGGWSGTVNFFRYLPDKLVDAFLVSNNDAMHLEGKQLETVTAGCMKGLETFWFDAKDYQ